MLDIKDILKRNEALPGQRYYQRWDIIPDVLYDTFRLEELINRSDVTLFIGPGIKYEKFALGETNMQQDSRLPCPEEFYIEKLTFLIPRVIPEKYQRKVIWLGAQLMIGCKYYLNRPVGSCYLATSTADINPMIYPEIKCEMCKSAYPADILNCPQCGKGREATNITTGVPSPAGGSLVHEAYSVFNSASFATIGGLTILNGQMFNVKILRHALTHFDVDVIGLPPIWVFIDGMRRRAVA